MAVTEKRLQVVKNGGIIAYISPRDGVSSCEIDVQTNGASTLSFSMKIGKKYNLLLDPLVSVIADGKVYSASTNDAISEHRDEKGAVYAEIKFNENWWKLGRKYVTAYNDTGGFDHVDLHMVVLLSKPKNPIVVNGETIEDAPYNPGTCNYLLWALTYKSGWTLNKELSVYEPDGLYDLETDQVSVLDNIRNVRDFFGGILIWDSVNQTVAIVDESKYRPYNGVRFAYKRNLKSISKAIDREVYTKIYPRGENGLNIAAVNSDKEYLEDYSYTPEVLEKVESNNDIADQDVLLAWGKRQLAKLSKPRISYEIEVSLAKRQGVLFQQRIPVCGEVAKVYDPEISQEETEQRIINVAYEFFTETALSLSVGSPKDTFERKLFEVFSSSAVSTRTIMGNGQIDARAMRVNNLSIGTEIENSTTSILENVKNVYLPTEVAQAAFSNIADMMLQKVDEDKIIYQVNQSTEEDVISNDKLNLDGILGYVSENIDFPEPGDKIPAGVISPYAGTSLPSGWLWCGGNEISRTQYAALFAAIGTTYGDGDGNTTFNLPDLRGRVVAMRGTSQHVGEVAGADSKKIERANLPAEKLRIADNGSWIVDTTQFGVHSGKPLSLGNNRSEAEYLYTEPMGSGTAFDVRQATIYLNYIIKY